MKRWSLLLCVCLGVACDDGPHYVGVSFEPQSAPPVPVSFEPDRIEIPVGIAVEVEVRPESSGEAYDKHDLLVLRADDEDLLGVYATEDERQFVFVGLREGETCLEVQLNRQQRECIDVRVVPVE
ncbi:MAG TPA: hypothetical protein VFZ61_04670 [Polyangiales bacterium]